MMKRKNIDFRFIVITVVLMGVLLPVGGQEKTLNIDLENVALKTVLDEIARQSGHRFFYRQDQVNDQEKVSYHVENLTLVSALDELFKGREITYSFQDKLIILQKVSKEVSPQEQAIPPPGIRVSGYVYDENNIPLPGVTVLVEGMQKGTITDGDGFFSIKLDGPAVLVVSFIGYETQRMDVSRDVELTVKMSKESVQIDEVVVVGYGVLNKSDITGAISKIQSEELNQLGTVHLATAMQGRLSGVQVIAQSGEPGEKINIRIRGTGTINNSDPIYVVDGMPTDDISYLSPGDISSIEVLKDASATAVYGSRGANGVVLISTMKGKTGEQDATIQVHSYFGIQEAWKLLDMCNAMEYARLRLQAYENDGYSIDRSEVLNESMYKEINKLNYIIDREYTGTNWQEEVLRKAFTQSHNINISGGGSRSSYDISALAFEQEGIVKNSQLGKTSFRLNTQYDLKEWLTGGISFTSLSSDQTYINKDLYTGVLTTALRADPVTPVWDPSTGTWGADMFSQIHNNPARNVFEAQFNRGYTQRYVTNLWGQAELSENLIFRSQYSFEREFYQHKRYYPEFNISTKEQRIPSELYDQRISGRNYVWTNYLNYTRDINAHSIKAMAGVEAQEMSSNNVESGALDVPMDLASQYFSSAKNKVDYSVMTDPDLLWEQAILSGFGRINYNYDNRYLVTVTFRADGSSKFQGTNRWGFFPSFSMGWYISRERFMDQVGVINRLKLRAGWGEVGNEGSVLNYQYLSTMAPDQIYVFGDQLVEGRMPVMISNPELRWETSKMTNLGFDMGLWENALDMTMDVFYKVTEDILVITPVPYYFGNGAPFSNAASMSNRGLEFSAIYRSDAIQNSEFKYEVGGNISVIRNRMEDLSGSDVIEGGKVGKLEAFTTRTEEGDEMAYFYGYRTDGIFNDEEELNAHVNQEGEPFQPNASIGDVRFVNVNGDDVLDADDRVKLGSANPDFTFGMNFSAFWKGLDFSIFFQGSYGNEAVNAMNFNNLNPDGIENSRRERLESWTSENNSDIYRMTFMDNNKNIGTFSDIWVEDASYLRLKNLQVGYSLPSNWLQLLGMRSLRIYLSANNLFTLTQYSGWDPEIGQLFDNPFNRGIDMGTYPHARVFMAGVVLTL
jgi:TonB-linked SusC/RagA family outer membrane protein